MDDATKARLEGLRTIFIECRPNVVEWDGLTGARWGAEILIASCRALDFDEEGIELLEAIRAALLPRDGD